MTQDRPIVIGEAAARTERIAAVERKFGSSGALCLVEERDMIYRGGGGRIGVPAGLVCRLAEQGFGRPIRAFGFRALRPFFLGKPLRLRGSIAGGDGATMRAFKPAGEAGMRVEVEFE